MKQILTRIRACEHLQKFCEHEQASTRLNFASKSSKDKILRAVEKFYDHSLPLIQLVKSLPFYTPPALEG